MASGPKDTENGAKSPPECFVIMRIGSPGTDEFDHFRMVYEDLLAPACRDAGYEPVRASDVKSSHIIHMDVVKRIIESPMVLCDLSRLNPNVMYELGMRHAFDKPVALVREAGTEEVFDISPVRYTEYQPQMVFRDVLGDRKAISDSIVSTFTEHKKGMASFVKLMALTAAKLPTGATASPEIAVVIKELARLNGAVSDLATRVTTMTGHPSVSPHMAALHSRAGYAVPENFLRELQGVMSEMKMHPPGSPPWKQLLYRRKELENILNGYGAFSTTSELSGIANDVASRLAQTADELRGDSNNSEI